MGLASTYGMRYAIRAEVKMHKKLTLSLDMHVIEKAKEYASEQNESLSGIVEGFLRAITNAKDTIEVTPIVGELLGSVSVPDGFDYEDEKHRYLREKHLND